MKIQNICYRPCINLLNKSFLLTYKSIEFTLLSFFFFQYNSYFTFGLEVAPDYQLEKKTKLSISVTVFFSFFLLYFKSFYIKMLSWFFAMMLLICVLLFYIFLSYFILMRKLTDLCLTLLLILRFVVLLNRLIKYIYNHCLLSVSS